jgi:hypothetical protein
VTRKSMLADDGVDGRVGVSAYVRFRDRPGLFYNSLSCHRSDGVVRCGIDCDGGGFSGPRASRCCSTTRASW